VSLSTFYGKLLSWRHSARRANRTRDKLLRDQSTLPQNELLLRWLRHNNRPGATQATLEVVKSKIAEAKRRADDDIVLNIRLAAHEAILNYEKRGIVRSVFRNTSDTIHQTDEIINCGHIAFAALLLNNAVMQWPKASSLKRIHSLMDGPGKLDAFIDDGTDVQISRRPGATTTLVVLAGHRQRFGISFSQLHYVWLSAIHANIVYLRDMNSLLYMAGLVSLGPLDSTIDNLAQRFRSLGTRKLVFIGNSGGVFGALYYGFLLGANNALCFAGPTSLDIAFAKPDPPVRQKLKDLHQKGLVPWPNLRDLLSENQITVRYFFGVENSIDTLHADFLGGLPNVSLEPLPGISDHFVLDGLAVRGDLAQIFASCEY
jgi:hypothetical protein